MSTLTKKRVRIKLDQDLGIPFSISNVLTGDSAETWQANATDIEIAVFNTDAIASVSDLTSINCKIQPSQIKELILADSTVASGSLDDTTTAATWTDGTQQHALFSFTNAEMNLTVPGSVQEFWLVFTGLTTAGSEVTLGAGKFFIHQDNNVAGDPPATNLGTAITIEEADARYETIGGAAGDMEASTYDPASVAGDAFDMINMVESAGNLILKSAERTTIGTVAPHIADTANPHAVTKSQVGLGNVDNTADAAKPISTATQTGLDGKQDILTVSDTAPVSPDAGDLWLDSTQTKLYTYYNDGSSSQWVSVNSGSSTAGSKTGWMDYNDATGSFSIAADTWTDMPNDGAGSFTNKAYKPAAVTDVIDESTGYLDFSDLPLGSEISLRNDITVTPNTNNALFELRYVLGTGAGEYALNFLSERLDSGSGVAYQRVITFPIYMGDTNTKNNAGKLQARLSTPGTIQNAGVYASIQLF
tara:strand:+ start:532 stop:1956 length:1425 start_codon:yes stop_codon:yes gene_type:complete